METFCVLGSIRSPFQIRPTTESVGISAESSDRQQNSALRARITLGDRSLTVTALANMVDGQFTSKSLSPLVAQHRDRAIIPPLTRTRPM